jgi:alkanesulfonate monooxygenase SsuD/methylene tetrahydromethanopterin reductase-like flavin-dependent oxidoreductase (luciferase family)
MRQLRIGVVVVTGDTGPARATARWTEIRNLALHAEALGFDTVWTIDELLWRPADKTPSGFWEGVAMAGAVAAVTSRIEVGTWVMSALHRNPGITAKAVETLDEISDGRFILGLGAGHAWPGQARAFGLPEDHVYERFEGALQVIVRCSGPVTWTSKGAGTRPATSISDPLGPVRARSRSCPRPTAQRGTATRPSSPTSGAATRNSAAMSASWVLG